MLPFGVIGHYQHRTLYVFHQIKSSAMTDNKCILHIGKFDAH